MVDIRIGALVPKRASFGKQSMYKKKTPKKKKSIRRFSKVKYNGDVMICFKHRITRRKSKKKNTTKKKKQKKT